MTDIRDEEIRDWLLRRLDASRSAALERHLFVDAELADRIDAIDCDLIDDCARGRLPAAEARRVRTRAAWRVRFAKALVESQPHATMLPPAHARASAVRPTSWGLACAASLLLAFAGIRWQWFNPARTQSTIDASALPVVTLLAEQRRGAASPLALPMHDGNVRVQAEIDDAAASPSSRYALSIADAERTVFVAHDLAPHTAGPYRFIEAIVPATALGPDMRRIIVANEGSRNAFEPSWDVQMPAAH